MVRLMDVYEHTQAVTQYRYQYAIYEHGDYILTSNKKVQDKEFLVKNPHPWEYGITILLIDTYTYIKKSTVIFASRVINYEYMHLVFPDQVFSRT